MTRSSRLTVEFVLKSNVKSDRMFAIYGNIKGGSGKKFTKKVDFY